VGDRVMGIGAEPFASHPRVKGLRARVLPESLGFAAAASVPIVFLTAYHCLVEVARLEKGQTVLIQAASGGVGQAAIQIAQHIGAEIFATVGSAGKRKLIMDRYGLPESHIFSSRMRTFKQGVLRLTNGKGADVVLNSLAGEMLNDSWECVAHLGVFVEIGKADIYKKSHLSMVPFDRSTTFAAIDLLALFDRQPQRMYESLGKVVGMFEEGILTPVEPLMPMSIGNIEAAFRLIATRKHVGKVIVEAESEAMVNAVSPVPAPLVLGSNGAYVVAGGLGDLGKRLCRLLARHGAKHIVTLSRRTLDDDIRDEFEREIVELGGILHIVKCDITDKASVMDAATFCRASLPPVRGIVHGGMILKVC
jgi:NADPH:quinone reductase-like Zn-dependent oxidoreductase